MAWRTWEVVVYLSSLAFLIFFEIGEKSHYYEIPKGATWQELVGEWFRSAKGATVTYENLWLKLIWDNGSRSLLRLAYGLVTAIFLMRQASAVIESNPVISTILWFGAWVAIFYSCLNILIGVKTNPAPYRPAYFPGRKVSLARKVMAAIILVGFILSGILQMML